MAFTIEGLPEISKLSKGDQILICTSEGLKSLSSEVLGNVFSDTSLFDNRTFSEINEANIQNISTHDKLRKWFAKDTSDELYLRYNNGNVTFIKEVVITDVETEEPVTIQATTYNGKKLYWTKDVTKAKFNNGLPWTTDDEKEEKITVTTDETEYPVHVYQYYSDVVKSIEFVDANGDFMIRDTFKTGNNSIGLIQKQDDSFLIELLDNTVAKCGLMMSKNPDDGSYSAKLIGVWENVNDWDIDDVLLKPEFKEWYYTNQDYYNYVNILSVNTANKIKWRLTKNTNNQVYSVLEDGYLKFYFAQIKTQATGEYIQEIVKNKFGKQLYWEDNMDVGGGVSSNGVPVLNGKYTFMTTTVTNYPVYVYQYNTTEIFSISQETLTDSSKGIRMKFGGVSNGYGEISRLSSGLEIRYMGFDSSTSKYVEKSKVVLGETSKLTGSWKVGEKDIIELPENPVDVENEHYLSNTNGVKTWKKKTKELPELPDEVTEPLFLSYDPTTESMTWVTKSELLGTTIDTPDEEPVDGDTTTT